MAEATPTDRNRYIDFLRAFSILVVVFGHWLMAAPEYADGKVAIGHLIRDVGWVQGLTWVLQVMPIFFFVGGWSNAASWRSARRGGVCYSQWLRDRLRRLILPVLPLLAVWAPAAYLAGVAGVDPELVRAGSQAALVPVWFLATYLLIVMLVPVTLAVWDRFGWRALVGLVLAAAAVDLANLGSGFTGAGWLNYLFVWNAVHLLGYAWADHRIGGTRHRLGLAGIGLAALTGLVWAGPYPVAMVGLDNAAVTNSNPPKVTLIALGLFQFGLALVLETPARRWLARVRPWTAVVAINGSIMSLYLWHLTAMVAVLAILISGGGIGLGLAANTPGWWLTRPLWLALLVLATMPFLAMFARFERPRPDRRPAPAIWRPLLAVLSVCAGLGLLAHGGIADADGLNGVALTLPVIGVVVGGIVPRPG